MINDKANNNNSLGWLWGKKEAMINGDNDFQNA